jgi:hypothetical protein
MRPPSVHCASFAQGHPRVPRGVTWVTVMLMLPQRSCPHPTLPPPCSRTGSDTDFHLDGVSALPAPERVPTHPVLSNAWEGKAGTFCTG